MPDAVTTGSITRSGSARMPEGETSRLSLRALSPLDGKTSGASVSAPAWSCSMDSRGKRRRAQRGAELDLAPSALGRARNPDLLRDPLRGRRPAGRGQARGPAHLARGGIPGKHSAAPRAPNAPEAAPLHRLGRWTSGIVLFARTRQSRESCRASGQQREIGKLYRALACGEPAQDEFEVSTPIGPVPHPTLGTVHAADPAGKPAQSRVSVHRAPTAEDSSAMCASHRPAAPDPHPSGRGRASAAGDPLYAVGGGIIAGTRAVPGDPGYLLHAAELCFRHPKDGRKLAILCEPPAELRADARSRGAT